MISDTQWGYQQRMDRTINRQTKLFFKYACEIFKTCGTAYNIYSGYLVAWEGADMPSGYEKNRKIIGKYQSFH